MSAPPDAAPAPAPALPAGARARRFFGPPSEKPFRRRATDWNRVVLGGLITAAAGYTAEHPTSLEAHAFTLINGLPGGLQPLLAIWYHVATFWAIALVVAAALLARRWRLAGNLAAAGVAAWVAGKLLGRTVTDRIGAGVPAIQRLHASPTFPFVPLAVLAAVVAAAGPYVSRPSRHVGEGLLIVLAPAGVYLGIAYPNDILGALALGWAIAAAVHLLFGSPAGRPTPDHVAAALEELRVPVTGIRLAVHEPEGATLMDADDAAGPLRIKVLGRDAGETQLLAKLARAVLYKDSGRLLQLTRVQEVEHEAYLLLLAAASQAAVPEVVVAGQAGPGLAVLVLREPSGVPIDTVGGAVRDEVLAGAWRALAALRGARIIHGRANTGSVLQTPLGAAITRFDLAHVAGPGQSGAADAAELLASTAVLVGVDRAVAAAVTGAGAAVLSEAMPLLQAAALTRRTRAAAGSRKDLRELLAHLRAAVAKATGTKEPALEELHRVSGVNLVLAVGTLFAAAGLLAAVGSPHRLWEAVGRAGWAWVAAAFVVSMATNLPQAAGIMGTVPGRLPLWPTTELEVAQSFSAVAVPLGSAAMRIRFLQHFGSDLSSAVAAGGLLATVGSMVAQILLLVVAVLASPHPVHLVSLPHNLPSDLLILLLVLAVVTGVVMGIPQFHRRVVKQVERAAETVWAALRSPRRMALLIGGNLAASMMFGLCLLACLEAFGAHASLWTLLALNIGINTLASLVPIPGGGAAVSAVALSGALVALGIPQEGAVAAVLTYQLVTRYLPAVPGWVATQDMIHRDYL